jgi:uncharacterized protein (TIGR03000 family)
MHSENGTYRRIALPAVIVLLWWQSPAKAQALPGWCRGVVTFGWTPYDWDETGLGHYYGKPPYSAVHRIFPEYILDQHQLSVPRIRQPPAEDEVPPPGAAFVIVKLPDEAELWFDETRTSLEGSYRRFVTPPLERDQHLVYALRVRWHIKDADLTRVEKVRVEPGKTVTVNFLTVDSWTGVRAETLPAPRKLP